MPASLRTPLARIASCALALGAGCVEPSIEEAEMLTIGVGTWQVSQLPPARQVDVLLVIDDSASMRDEQATLAANLASFVHVLEAPRSVPLDYRIGITTTDDGNPTCASTPKAGALQLRSCREHLGDFVGALESDGSEIDVSAEGCIDRCPPQWAHVQTVPTTIVEDDELRPRPWLERVEGRTNLPEGLSMEQALECVAPQGIGGCELEAPLESMAKALRRSFTDDDPALGFLRSTASLLVVIVTDEADCSIQEAWEGVLSPDGDRALWPDPAADAPTSAVCWNAGVACEGDSPYDDCRAVDRDAQGQPVSEHDAAALAVLHPVSRYVELLRALEDHKRRTHPDRETAVRVVLVGGVDGDGSVTYRDSPEDPEFERDHGIGPGCESDAGRAAPPVRVRALAQALAAGSERTMVSICDHDYSVALEGLAESLIDRFRPACVPACVADLDPSTPDVLDPWCVLVQSTPTAQGGYEERDVPPCLPDDALPEGHDVCHVALVGHERSEYCVDQGFNLEFRLVHRSGAYPYAGAWYEATCVVSSHPTVDCQDLP